MNIGILGRSRLLDGQWISSGAGTPTLVSEVIERLESGEAPADLVRSTGLAPVDLIAAVAFDPLSTQDGGAGSVSGPALVQARPKWPERLGWLTEDALAGLFPRASRPIRLALSAGLLQVYDFWNESHEAAQRADDLGEGSVSAYWHGIAHRREPDAGNAAYWFRRVGRHPIFKPLADAAFTRLASTPVGLDIAPRLLPRDAWDPNAFLSLCQETGGERASIARSLQTIEMSLLLEASLPPGN